MRNALAVDERLAALQWPKRLLFFAAAAIAVARGVEGQAAVVAGSVYRDSAGRALSNVEVSLNPIGLQTKTNYAGEFRFRGIPAGRYELTFHRVGFPPLTDSVVLRDRETVDREYVLFQLPVALDSVRVTEVGREFRSPLLQEFDERTRAHLGGHFIGDSVIRKNESRKVQDLIISYVPGLRVYRPRDGAEYLTSARSPCVRAFCAASTCPVALFVDGLAVFNPAVTKLSPRDETPDLNGYTTADFSGIEFYAGGATIPPRFNATGSSCGVLLLWTRDRVKPEK